MLKVMNGLDLQSQKIQNLADASAATDAVTLQQMQAFVRGLSWKASVRVASTANLTLATPGATIDGVTMATNDRVLLKNQSAGAENGIYVWTGASSLLTRALDADSAAEVTGAAVLVTEGTTNGNKAFTQTADAVTLGTTALVWTEFGGGGSSYTGGAGLTLSGSDFAVGQGTGISVAADAVAIDTAVVVRKYAANIGNGAATSIAVTHSLGTRDITYSIQNASTFEFVETDAVATDANTLTLTFATAPASNAYRVVVHG